MIRSLLKQALSLAISAILTTAPVPIEAGAQQSSGPPPSYSGQGAPQTAEELQSLVAPIALYPDALVAQILGAATFPDQIAVANYWLQQNKNLTGNALMEAVDKQSWDPSVKALTQFPTILDNMAKNLSWTSSLGEAYHNQASDVMSAVQTLRTKAQAAGNLKSGSQITVVQQTPSTIVIQPANPQVVYVPQYNPAVVYGTPYTTPGYSTGALVATGLLSFGAGIAVGSLISGGGGGCCGWGWNSWNCNWHGGTVVYNQNNFYGNRAWHGGYYGGATPYRGGYNGSRGAYGSYGSRTMQTSYGGKAGVHTTPYGNSFAGKTANGNEYAEHNGNAYRNTGSGWQKDNNGNWSNVNKPNGSSLGSSDAARGWGQKEAAGGSSAFSGWGSHSGGDDRFGGGSGGWGSGGWGSRSASARGWGSRGGGGGWGGGGWGGGGFHGGGGFRR